MKKKKKLINELQIFITKVMTTLVEKNLYFKRKKILETWNAISWKIRQIVTFNA